MSQLKRRITRLEVAKGGSTDVGAALAERLAEMRRNAKRAESDPEFASQLQREGEERFARMEQAFNAGRLEGFELRIYLASREEKRVAKITD